MRSERARVAAGPWGTPYPHHALQASRPGDIAHRAMPFRVVTPNMDPDGELRGNELAHDARANGEV